MQFLLKENPDKEGLIRLCGDDYHYLVHVRRLKPGAVFQTLLPPDSHKTKKDTHPQHARITVLSIDKHSLTGSVSLITASKDSAIAHNNELPPIVVFQALPKGTKMDMIVRQAAELGISEIVPFISEYSVPKKSDGRTDRLRRIVKEARQQSLSAVDTQVHDLLSADELFAYWEKLQIDYSKEALGLLFIPPAAKVYSTELHSNESSPLEKCGFHQYLNNKPPILVLTVGPEGGFSTAEADRFLNAGFKALSLGETILRTETAALAGAAAAKIILMERAWWKTTQP